MSGKITTSDIKTVGRVASVAGFFVPSSDMKRCKSIFWSRWKMGPARSSDTITLAAAVDITGLSILENWWKEDGFKQWFVNENSYTEDADHNANLALETLRELMFSDNPNIRLKAAVESVKLKTELDKASAGRNDDMDITEVELRAMVEQYLKLVSLTEKPQEQE